MIYQLRKAGYSTKKLVSVYYVLIRPILEYAAPVWSALPLYLAADIGMVRDFKNKLDSRSAYFAPRSSNLFFLNHW